MRGTLSYNLGIQSAVYDDRLAYLLGLRRIQEIAASCGKFLLYCVINLIKYDNRLLRSTYHTVIKCF